MSVRRLADEALQPAQFAFSNDNARWAQAKMAEYPAGRQQSAVIPLLMRAQEQDGWITRAAIESIARMLDMAYIRVLEVVTFYTQFQLKPVGTRAHIQVCGTTPCMLRGAEDLRAVCQHKINHEPFETNATGTLSWEEVECLGACVNAPMVAIFQDTYEDLTAARLEEIIDAFDAGKGETIKPGPQIDRMTSAAAAGPTTLLEQPTKFREKFVPPPPPETPAAATAPATAPAAPVAPATSAAPAAPAAPHAAQAPTTKGRPRDVSEESAPALKEPAATAKVSVAKAEAERATANASAKADGEPARAMRPEATGAESPAGKINGGMAVDKPEHAVSGQAPGTPPFTAPEGGPDNLKLMTGVGPKLEAELNALGITRFGQIAAFTPEDMTKLDAALSFKGRIVRDNWIKQADALARGGVAEHERVFGKKPR